MTLENNITSQQGQTFHYDVLVIGSGIAGLSYALEVSALKPTARIALISKTTLQESNSLYAQGGIAAAANNPEALQQHEQDTLNAGRGLCKPDAVHEIIQAAPEVIHWLQNQGVQFDRHADSTPDLVQEGGHSERRIYHQGDTTGKGIVISLIAAVQKCAQITLLENQTAVNLIHTPPLHIPAERKEIIGAYILNNQTGLIDTFLSKVTVLATGGAGKVYRYTTNPDVATGDGIAMAYRAGARVENMEFYQFHPTLFYHPKLHNFLISEALRGEGAYLLDPVHHQRFMLKYEPEKGELAARDVIARAIFSEIENNGFKFVYLDLRHKPKAFLEKRFPNIYHTLFKLGIDMSSDLIPVVPAAHYLCGGILTDVAGQTDLKRLYAIGEAAFTGLHGANRLASNSLLEGVVMGRKAAAQTLSLLAEEIPAHRTVRAWTSPSIVNTRRASQINAHWRGLRGEMSSYAGIVRTEAGLRDLLNLIEVRKASVAEYYWQHLVTQDLLELRNIILIAELIVKAALKRKESCGGHFREDTAHSIDNSKA
jgi:L-aspartate oxidase